LDDKALRRGVLGEEFWVCRHRPMAAGNRPIHRSPCAGSGPSTQKDVHQCLIKGK
ncbi:hypothetical protein NDU88_003122, partial [Pleurodeles waltl]